MDDRSRDEANEGGPTPNDENLDEALAYLRQHPGINIKGTARQFNVPYIRLYRTFKRSDAAPHHDTRPSLAPAMEYLRANPGATVSNVAKQFNVPYIRLYRARKAETIFTDPDTSGSPQQISPLQPAAPGSATLPTGKRPVGRPRTLYLTTPTGAPVPGIPPTGSVDSRRASAVAFRLSGPEERTICRLVDYLDRTYVAMRQDFLRDVARYIVGQRMEDDGEITLDRPTEDAWLAKFLWRHKYDILRRDGVDLASHLDEQASTPSQGAQPSYNSGQFMPNGSAPQPTDTPQTSTRPPNTPLRPQPIQSSPGPVPDDLLEFCSWHENRARNGGLNGGPTGVPAWMKLIKDPDTGLIQVPMSAMVTPASHQRPLEHHAQVQAQHPPDHARQQQAHLHTQPQSIYGQTSPSRAQQPIASMHEQQQITQAQEQAQQGLEQIQQHLNQVNANHHGHMATPSEQDQADDEDADMTGLFEEVAQKLQE